MLVQFSVKNFRSIHEEIFLSMVATRRRSRVPGLDNGATFTAFDDISLLKTAVIYGANASGKSNIARAIGFFRNFVLQSSKESQIDEPIKVEPFSLAHSSEKEGSTFEITFIKDEHLYQYGFEADRATVRKEYLKQKARNSKRTRVLFERDGNDISIERSFEEGKGLEKKTRRNALFLSVCANFDGEISSAVLRWFQNLNLVSGLHDQALMPYTLKCLTDPTKRDDLATLLSNFDLGFDRLEVQETSVDQEQPNIPDELRGLFDEIKKIQKKDREAKIKKVFSVHNVAEDDLGGPREVYFDFGQESEGTQKIVALSGPLLDTLETSKILFIDEFDARLHPAITRTIIELFNSSSNSKNAQLIVATHDTNILDNQLLRRDQIWFVEKDRYEASHLTSLDEFKVRSDASFEKDYIAGKYGAIPFVGNLKRLFGQHEGQEFKRALKQPERD